jgi:uncharacterized protein
LETDSETVSDARGKGPSEMLEPFYDATDKDVLVLPHCRRCARFHWGPSPYCPYCAADDWYWRKVTGPARLFTWAEVHRALDPNHRHAAPFFVGLVELDDAPGVRMVTSFRVTQPSEVGIGMDMTLGFDVPLGGGKRLPVFVPRTTGGSE